jgi:hypothetical protein
MVAILLFAAVTVGVLGVILARWSPPSQLMRSYRADPRPPMPPDKLRALTVELLRAMGYTEERTLEGEALLCTRRDALGETRLVALVPSISDEGVVDQPTILAALETVRAEGAARGLLITVGELETAGLAALDPILELIDGPRFRRLVARHLPTRLDELDRYRSFNDLLAGPLAPRPTPA